MSAKILFVSEQDVCRGPFARALAARFAAEGEVIGVEFDSAGVGVSKPERCPAEFVFAARDYDVDLTAHRSKALTRELLTGCAVAVCMTRDIALQVRKSFPGALGERAVTLVRAAGLDGRYGDFEPIGRTAGGWQSLASTLLAAVGRIVRRVDFERDIPGALGAGQPIDTGNDAMPNGLSQLGQIVYTILRGANKPLATREIVERATRMRQPLDAKGLASLMLGELRRHVRRVGDAGWEPLIAGRAPAASETAPPPPKRAPSPASSEKAAPPPPASEPPPKQPAPSVRVSSAAEACEVLGIAREVDMEEARRAYRSLIARYHPDRFHDDPEFLAMAEEKARRINAAWEYLEKNFGK